MKLNQKMQYAILLALYLNRSGKARLSDVAVNLNLSHDMLQSVARQLRIAGVTKVTRGPTGGVSLAGDVTLREVVNAIEPIRLIPNELSLLSSAAIEERTLQRIGEGLSRALTPILKVKLSDISKYVVQAELELLDKVVESHSCN